MQNFGTSSKDVKYQVLKQKGPAVLVTIVGREFTEEEPETAFPPIGRGGHGGQMEGEGLLHHAGGQFSSSICFAPSEVADATGHLQFSFGRITVHKNILSIS